jgi:hypothetical protein
MAEQMYNLGGKPTPYSQLPASVKAALGKRAIRQATQKKKKPAPKPVQNLQSKSAPKQSAVTRASGTSSYKGMTAREIMREREQLYKQGYHNLSPVGFKMTNDSRNAPPKNYAEALRRDQAAGFYQNVDTKDLGKKGMTWDQRMTAQFDYTVRDPSTGESKTFDSQQQAQAFINANPLKQTETTTTEKFSVVGNNGKTRTFKTMASAEKYAKTQTTTTSSYIGFGKDGTPIQGAPAPEYVEVKYPKPGDKVLIHQMGKDPIEHTITQKPLSSSGQRLELIAGWLDEQQIKAKKADKVTYYKDPYGVPQRQGGVNLLPMAIEGAKDLVAGAAYLENLFWKGEAMTYGGEQKTRDIKIPETAMGTLLTGAFEGKSFPDIWKSGAEYEKTYGRGTILAGGATALIPIPGLKGLNIIKSAKASPLVMKLVTPVAKVSSKVSAKIKVPQIKNVFAKLKEGAIDIGQKRTVMKYAITRQSEGVFGVSKVSKNIWKIERGVEEVPKLVTGKTKLIQTGWTKAKGIIYPQFAKQPKNLIIPKPGITSKVPLTIIEFGKDYIRKGSKLTEASIPFKKPAAMKLPIMKKAPKKTVTKRPKKFSKIIKKSLGFSSVGFGLPKGGFGKMVSKSLGIGYKKKRIKAKKIKLTEVTDFQAVKRGEYQTVGTKKVLLTAADPDFVKQAKGLKLEKISTTGYAGKMSKNLLEAEQLGLVKLSAIGKSIPLNLAKEGKFAGFMGKQSRITKVFELGKGGLGKADFTIDVTKKGKQIISVGSKDFTRALEGVGLGTKRIMTGKGKIVDSSTIPTSIGRAGGGAAARLEETTKKSIIGSFAKTESKNLTKPINISLEKLTGAVPTIKPAGAGIMGGTIVQTKTHDYFKTENIYKRNRIKKKGVFSDSELVDEYSVLELGKIAKTSGNTIVIPRLMRPGATRQLTRTETKLLGGQKTKISLDVKPKIKSGLLTKQVEKLAEKYDQFRIQIPKLGTITKTKVILKVIETPKLKLETPTRFRIQYRYDTPPIRITKIPPGFIPLNIKAARRKQKHDKDKTFSADFLGASSESSVLGLTGRKEITYGRLKTLRLTALDLRKRKKAGSSINPENIKFKKKSKKKDPDWGKPRKRSGRQISKDSATILFGSNKKVKF